MQRIAPKTIWRLNMSALSLLPGFVFAGNPAPDDYLTNSSWVLEVRYCECQATETESLPADLLPDFLKESGLLKVGVSDEDQGFVSSRELSIGYELRPVQGSPDRFQFNYAGNYTTSGGNHIGKGKLLLTPGQWVNLFGSQHESETGIQHSDVAVRLIKTGK